MWVSPTTLCIILASYTHTTTPSHGIKDYGNNHRPIYIFILNLRGHLLDMDDSYDKQEIKNSVKF